MIAYDRNLFGEPIVSTLVADPPWSFSDDLPGEGRGAAKHYPCMTLDELVTFRTTFAFELARDAYLLLWKVGCMTGDAIALGRAWGFREDSEMVWLKRTRGGKRWFGMGRTVRWEHETCLIMKRGAPAPLHRSLRSTFTGIVRDHSTKPDEFYDLVEATFPGPRAELFARRRRAGWIQHGNELPALAG